MVPDIGYWGGGLIGMWWLQLIYIHILYCTVLYRVDFDAGEVGRGMFFLY